MLSAAPFRDDHLLLVVPCGQLLDRRQSVGARSPAPGGGATIARSGGRKCSGVPDCNAVRDGKPLGHVAQQLDLLEGFLQGHATWQARPVNLNVACSVDRKRPMSDYTIIAAGQGKAFRLGKNQRSRIGLPEGPQVADMFAFAVPDLDEFLSTQHTRSCAQRLTPVVGEAFYSNRRRPMLAFEGDSSPGTHDLLLSACDQARYTLLGHSAPHRNCVANMTEALAELGLKPPEIPSPVNLFEKVAIGSDGSLVIEPPLAARGDSVTLRALMDLVLVISACPMDIVPTNGADLRPKAIFVELADAR